MADDPEAFLNLSLNSDVHELDLLHAIVLSKADFTAPQRLRRLRDFVPTIGNWAVCDLLCNDLKPSGAFRDALLPLLREYARSDSEFEVRFAYVMLMLYYRDAAHIDETFRLYEEFRHDGYYARMGVAWGMSFLYVDYPERTVQLLNSLSLDPFTHNKSIQKIIESLRVEDADKQFLRTLRRSRAPL